MNEQLIERIMPELREELIGLYFREVFQLRDSRFAIAFEGDDFKLLFVAIEPKQPRMYLIKRRVRDLKRVKQNASKFAVDTEKALAGMQLTELSKREGDRVIEFRFESDETRFLIAQLTGKSSNLFLLDPDRIIVAAARKPGAEQSMGLKYSTPIRTSEQNRLESGQFPQERGLSLSEALDAYFLNREEQDSFAALAGAAKKKNQNAQAKLKRLIKNLEADIQLHGNAEKWKKFGDLLLANQSQAQRQGASYVVLDLYNEAAPFIAIEADENDSIAEAARKYFRKYAKARTAAAEIASRIETVRMQLAVAEAEFQKIDKAVDMGDAEFLAAYVSQKKNTHAKAKAAGVRRLPAGVRSFLSSDGFEILVGKKAADNDYLTFRIANSRDTWMHAADYPGSHVLIRNPDRKEIPPKTLIEAAQLAAFYSQGKKQVKAAVNYTEKKFVNKPKGAGPGLVRLASFKTILVEPIFPNVLQA